MNICFIFPQIHNHNNERHLRNIFNIENYNIDYLFTESHNKPSHQQKVLNNYYIKHNNIKHNNIKFLTDDLDNIIDTLNKYDIILMCVFPFISEYINEKFNDRIEKRINKNIIKIYIHHGLYKVFDIDQLVNKKKGDRVIRTFDNRSPLLNRFKYKIVTCCENYQKLLFNSNFRKTNIIKTNSLPQFDLNNYLYNKVKKRENEIIIFIGETVEQIKDNIIFKLIDVIRKIYPDKKIFIKIKFTTNIKNFEKYLISNYKNIELLSHDKYLGDYLKCFLCIITGGGTSFFENINFNKKTILFQYKINSFDKTLFFKYPDIFNKLPICDNLENIEKIIKNIEHDTYFDNNYYNDIKKLNNFHIGHEKIMNFKYEFINFLKKI
jgi:hypothetical protein